MHLYVGLLYLPGSNTEIATVTCLEKMSDNGRTLTLLVRLLYQSGSNTDNNMIMKHHCQHAQASYLNMQLKWNC